MKRYIIFFTGLAILISALYVCQIPVSTKINNEDVDYWSSSKINKYSKKYNIHDKGYENFHFPQNSFLKSGYSPPGGYVKDFAVIYHDDRWHFFYIDGRPGETCWITGNEISFGHASTSNFQHMLRHNMPLAISWDNWDNRHIWAPFVYKFNDMFFMFYTGLGDNGSFISIATSQNLEFWDKTGAPILEAPGRDPFVFQFKEQIILLYTYKNRIGACSSNDLKKWEKMDDIITIPKGAPESCSVHQVGDKFLLWFNGAHTSSSPDSIMLAFYAFSDSPFNFNNASIKQFRFITDPKIAKVNSNFIIQPNSICPISIEKIAGNGKLFFITYFRPQEDRYKLFYGKIDLMQAPLTIIEINDKEEIMKCLQRLDIQISD
jgi:hypothetical protein